MPPMEFHQLLDNQVSDMNIKTEIQKLLKRKMAGEEFNVEPKIQILNDFLEQKIEFYNNYVKSIVQNTPPDTAKLDELFKETIYEAWEK